MTKQSVVRPPFIHILNLMTKENEKESTDVSSIWRLLNFAGVKTLCMFYGLFLSPNCEFISIPWSWDKMLFLNWNTRVWSWWVVTYPFVLFRLLQWLNFCFFLFEQLTCAYPCRFFFLCIFHAAPAMDWWDIKLEPRGFQWGDRCQIVKEIRVGSRYHSV